MQTPVREVKYLLPFVFPGSLGNSANMLAFLILSDYWVLGVHDLSFVLPEKQEVEKFAAGWKASCGDCGRPVGSSTGPLPQGHTQVAAKEELSSINQSTYFSEARSLLRGSS